MITYGPTRTEQSTKKQNRRTRISDFDIGELLDADGSLLAKNDRSMMDSIKIWVKRKMDKKEYDTKKFKDRLGKKFYLED